MNYKTGPDYKAPTRDTKQRFIKKMNYIIKCKVCGKEMRSYTGRNVKVSSRLCRTHRKGWLSELRKRYRALPRNKIAIYTSWRRWVAKNIERRRRLALESYHRNKDKPSNLERRHRATKKTG